MTKAQKAEQAEAIGELRKMLPPGSRVYTVLRHVSRSGMFRRIDLYVMTGTNGSTSPQWLSGYAARALGIKLDRSKQGLPVGGCGMDMGFHLVNSLSYALYPDGFGCIGDRCPANDHANGDRDYTPHAVQYTPETCPGRPCGEGCDHKSGPGRDHWHNRGAAGYALKHEWL